MASSDIELHEWESMPRAEDDARYGITSIEEPENAQPAMLPVSHRQQLGILLCSFFDVFLTIGLNQAYGVFLTYYLDPGNNSREAFLPPSQLKNKALVAFVGTLAAGLTWSGSIFVNPLMARTKDPRRITMAGAALIGLGYVLASFTHGVRQT